MGRTIPSFRIVLVIEKRRLIGGPFANPIERSFNEMLFDIPTLYTSQLAPYDSSYCLSHYEEVNHLIADIIMPMSQLVKPSLLFRSTCAQLNLYGHRHHCGKQISSYIHDKSILLLGHLDACNIDRRRCILTSLNLSINQSSSQLLFKQVTSSLSMILLSSSDPSE